MTDYYTILGVRRDAALDEIKAAYRTLVKQVHPDHNHDSPDAGQRFRNIHEAFEILADPKKRAEYDKTIPDNRIAKSSPDSSPNNPKGRTSNPAPKEGRPGPAPAYTGYSQSVAIGIEETVEGLLRPAGPIEIRKALISRAIQCSSDKEGLIRIATDSDKHRLSKHNYSCEDRDHARIAAGERYVVLEDDPVQLFGVARNGLYFGPVNIAAGEKFAKVADKRHINHLSAFSGSGSVFTDYCSQTSAGTHEQSYKNEDDPRKASRIAAGLKLVELLTYMPELLDVMNNAERNNRSSRHHYLEVRNEAGFKLIRNEESDMGLMRIWTDAKDLPDVRQAAMDKINLVMSAGTETSIAKEHCQKTATAAQPIRRPQPPPLPQAALEKMRQR